jgi:hypothetical protein
MAYDLFFRKTTPSNFSRETVAPAATVTAAADKSAAKVTELVALKTAADKGDKKAQKRWKKVSKKLNNLQAKANKGDLRAVAAIAKLTPAGLVATTVAPMAMKAAMRGEFVGDDKLVEILTSGTGYSEILGRSSLNDDESAVANDGGACERAALRRANQRNR